MTLVRDRRVGIRAVEPRDLQALYRLETDPELGDLWRFDGKPGFDAYVHRIQGGLLLGCVIELNRTGELVGAVFAHSYSARTRSAEVALVEAPSRSGSMFTVAGFGMFVNHLFEEYPLTRLLAWTGAANLQRFKHALGPLFTQHAVLDTHGGDARYLLGIDREGWFERFRPIVISRIQRWSAPVDTPRTLGPRP